MRYAIKVPGSVVTKQTAPSYYKNIVKMLYEGIDTPGAFVLDEIAERIVNAGFLTWDEVEAIEIDALKTF